MAKYRVKETSFIGNSLVPEDTVVEYDGIPGPNLEPLDTAAEVAAEAAPAARIEDIARQKMAAAGGDPDQVDEGAAVSAAAEAAEKAIADSGAAAGLV